MGCPRLPYQHIPNHLKVVHGTFAERAKKRINDYRYAFNGMEHDDEIKGENNSYDFGARLYDPRLGRFLSTDPLADEFPWQSSYCAFNNNPVIYIDPDGRAAVNGDGGNEPPGGPDGEPSKESQTASNGGLNPGNNLGEQIMNSVKGVQFNAYSSSIPDAGTNSDDRPKDGRRKRGFNLDDDDDDDGGDNGWDYGDDNGGNNSSSSKKEKNKNWGLYGGLHSQDWPVDGVDFVFVHAQSGNYRRYKIFGGKRDGSRYVEAPAKAKYRNVKQAANYNHRNELHYGDDGYRDIGKAASNVTGIWFFYNNEKTISQLSNRKVKNYNAIMKEYESEKAAYFIKNVGPLLNGFKF